MIMKSTVIITAALLGSLVSSASAGDAFLVDSRVKPLLEKYCFNCHDEDEQKGDIRLDALESLALDARLDLLNNVHEQIFIGEMPPKKKKQPTEAERNLLVEWLSKDLQAHGASKLEDKLRKPEYGNVVNHEKLFSGQYKDLPGFTPDRRWLISEYIFDTKFNHLLGIKKTRDIDGKRMPMIGGSERPFMRINITNPFLLPTHSGVRYYDTTTLDGGHFLTMVNNAREFSAFLMSHSKHHNSLPAYNKIMATEWAHEGIVANRQSYLKSNIEPLLRELYQDKNEALLPVYVASKPVEPKDAQGKPLRGGEFDGAIPSRDDLDEIYSAMGKHSPNGEKQDEALVTTCEREWFISGVNELNIRLRVTFMRTWMDELLWRRPKAAAPYVPKPPVDSELAIIRTAILKHRKAGDTYAAIIAKCTEGWVEEFKQERLKEPPLSDTMLADLVDLLFTKILERSPTAQEKADDSALMKSYIQQLGNEQAFSKLIETFMLRSDFVYRSEFGAGQADEHGRKMLYHMMPVTPSPMH